MFSLAKKQHLSLLKGFSQVSPLLFSSWKCDDVTTLAYAGLLNHIIIFPWCGDEKKNRLHSSEIIYYTDVQRKR